MNFFIDSSMFAVVFYLSKFILLLVFFRIIARYIFTAEVRDTLPRFTLAAFDRLIRQYRTHSWMVALGFTFLTVALIEYSHPSASNSPIEPGWYLWLSNLLPFFLSYALIFGSKRYMTFVFLCALVYESTWSTDFYGRVFFNWAPFGGQADYMYGLYLENKLFFFSNLNHVWYLPVSLWGLVKLGVDRWGFLTVAFWAMVINMTTWLVVPESSNINCVRQPCNFGLKINNILNPLADYSRRAPFLYLILWTLLPVPIIFAPLNWLAYRLDLYLRSR